jgi:hypothetical protein
LNRLFGTDPGHLWSIWAPLFLALVFWWSQARYGFAPIDDGAMLAQAWRVVNAEIPHVDFDSIRPVGSAIIHAPFTLLPWGMLVLDRLVVTLECLWIAAATTFVVVGRRGYLPIEKFLLIVIAFFVNVGIWPMMAWHTIDGLFLGVTAIWLVSGESNSRFERIRWMMAWILAGSAPFVKQGFIMVPIALIVWLAFQRKWTGLRYVPAVLVPGIVYLIATRGRVDAAFEQITRSSRPTELLDPGWTLLSYVQSPGGMLALALALMAALVMRDRFRKLAARVAVSGVIMVFALLWPMYTERLALVGLWSFGVLLALVVVSAMLTTQLEEVGLVAVVLLLALSVSVSRGVMNPGFLAGSMLVAALVILWGIPREPRSESLSVPNPISLEAVTLNWMNWSRIGIATVIALGVLAISLVSRNSYVYGEGARSNLEFTVDIPSFALIKMSERSAAYVEVVDACVRSNPAAQVAVIPDGPAFYALLHLRNPFANDWFAPGEIDYYRAGPGTDAHAKDVQQTIARLNDSSDWLVLTQALPFNGVNTSSDVNASGSPYGYFPGDEKITSRLEGTDVTCGFLSGKYRPSE